MKKNTNVLRLAIAEYCPGIAFPPSPDQMKIFILGALILCIGLRLLGQSGTNILQVPASAVAMQWTNGSLDGTPTYALRATWLPTNSINISGMHGKPLLKSVVQLRFATSYWRSSLDTVAANVSLRSADPFVYQAAFDCRNMHPVKSADAIWVEWVFTLENGQSLGDAEAMLDGIILVDLIEGMCKISDVDEALNRPSFIFPNPAAESLNLQLMGADEAVDQVTVHDMRGANLRTIPCMSTLTTIDLQGMNPGYYTLYCWQGNRHVRTFKFVKI